MTSRRMKMLDINKKVEAVISKVNEWETKKGEIELFIDGSYQSFPVERRYMDKNITLCIKVNCDAVGDCTHYFEKEDIGLCQEYDTYYDILFKGSVIVSHLTWPKEQELFETINSILREIHDRIDDDDETDD